MLPTARPSCASCCLLSWLTEPRAELLDPALPRGVGIEPDGRGDLLVVVAAHRDLLRLADQHELPRPGGGVDGAAGGPEGGEHGQPCAPAPGDESGHGSKDTRLKVSRASPPSADCLWCGT